MAQLGIRFEYNAFLHKHIRKGPEKTYQKYETYLLEMETQIDLLNALEKPMVIFKNLDDMFSKLNLCFK